MDFSGTSVENFKNATGTTLRSKLYSSTVLTLTLPTQDQIHFKAESSNGRDDVLGLGTNHYVQSRRKSSINVPTGSGRWLCCCGGLDGMISVTAPMANKAVLPHALKTPAFTKLSNNKRIILASASPRRKTILGTFGLNPEIVPSTFEETLSHLDFPNVYEYPVSTATEKAVEVYEKLVNDDPDNPPDLVIGADTVVLSRIEPATSNVAAGLEHAIRPEILEKPTSKADNLRMLLDLNGRSCEVVTGVSVVFPILTAPGYATKSMDERSIVYFADNPVSLLEAYADNGEGLDRAGGFAIQGLGGMLIRKVDGDWHNVVGFPAAAFFKFLEILVEEEEDFLAVD